MGPLKLELKLYFRNSMWVTSPIYWPLALYPRLHALGFMYSSVGLTVLHPWLVFWVFFFKTDMGLFAAWLTLLSGCCCCCCCRDYYLHPAPTALPPQMIVSTALLRVCLSVRPQWLVLCSMWLRSSPVSSPPPSAHPPPFPTASPLRNCPIFHLSALSSSPTLSHLEKTEAWCIPDWFW